VRETPTSKTEHFVSLTSVILLGAVRKLGTDRHNQHLGYRQNKTPPTRSKKESSMALPPWQLCEPTWYTRWTV